MAGVIYALRLLLPDRPGSLGAVATAIGAVGGDILSVDVVERGPAGAVDDMLVELPRGALADALLTAAHAVPGVTVESIRPHLGTRGVDRDLELVDRLAADPGRGLDVLARHVPDVFRAAWALLVETTDDGPRVVGASVAAPDTVRLALPWLPLPAARPLDGDADWVPGAWRALGLELMAAPVGRPDLALLVGRPGPRFRASEVVRLAHLASVAATVTRQFSPR